MNKMGYDYGEWLRTMEWNYLATIRLHYGLTALSSDRMMSKLIKQKGIDRLFFALERDRDCQMNHVHLLLQASSFLDRERLAKALSVNNKAVGYFEAVESRKKISHYCSKNLGKSFSHHNFFLK